MVKKIASKLTPSEIKILNKLNQQKSTVFAKFPLLFTLLGAFGLVATFYGFERIIDQVDWLNENPWLILLIGLTTLLLTGTLYKRLQ